MIGVDMTDAMITRARENVARAKVSNVEIRKGIIEEMPVGRVGDHDLDVEIAAVAQQPVQRGDRVRGHAAAVAVEYTSIDQAILDGFSTDNYQARVNGLTYGLDGWVYGACGLFGGGPVAGNDVGHRKPVTGVGDRRLQQLAQADAETYSLLLAAADEIQGLVCKYCHSSIWALTANNRTYYTAVCQTWYYWRGVITVFVYAHSRHF